MKCNRHIAQTRWGFPLKNPDIEVPSWVPTNPLLSKGKTIELFDLKYPLEGHHPSPGQGNSPLWSETPPLWRVIPLLVRVTARCGARHHTLWRVIIPVLVRVTARCGARHHSLWRVTIPVLVRSGM